jgi:hypothetical protein
MTTQRTTLDDGRPSASRSGVGGSVTTRTKAEGAIEGWCRSYHNLSRRGVAMAQPQHLAPLYTLFLASPMVMIMCLTLSVTLVQGSWVLAALHHQLYTSWPCHLSQDATMVPTRTSYFTHLRLARSRSSKLCPQAQLLASYLHVASSGVTLLARTSSHIAASWP